MEASGILVSRVDHHEVPVASRGGGGARVLGLLFPPVAKFFSAPVA